MNPYAHLESEKTRIEEERHFMIENKEYLCDYGGLHLMISRKGKYIPGYVYNKMKEIFIKYWKDKSLLVLDSSEEIPNFTNYEILEINIKCDICTTQLWNDM